MPSTTATLTFKGGLGREKGMKGKSIYVSSSPSSKAKHPMAPPRFLTCLLGPRAPGPAQNGSCTPPDAGPRVASPVPLLPPPQPGHGVRRSHRRLVRWLLNQDPANSADQTVKASN